MKEVAAARAPDKTAAATSGATVPRLYHLLAAAFIAVCWWLAARHPDVYSANMQEDRPVEWASVCFFAAAGAIILSQAVRRRRVFDGLVGLFCLFFAGEEMSWGQRLFGLIPPAYFLEHNTQQELNVHNFGVLFDSPKWPLMVVLLGYAALLPGIGMTERGRHLLARLGATPPPIATIPWFAVSIVLLYWYPVRFTGEWVEALVGSAFFVTTGIRTATLLASSAAVAVVSAALTAWSSKGATESQRVACATAEVQALADGLTRGGADPDLVESRSVHKRVWTLSKEGYVDFDILQRRLAEVRCANDRGAASRRRFAVDPWGTAYWVRVRRDSGASRATVYSFGPNRRRDQDGDMVQAGDDIVTQSRIAAP